MGGDEAACSSSTGCPAGLMNDEAAAPGRGVPCYAHEHQARAEGGGGSGGGGCGCGCGWWRVHVCGRPQLGWAGLVRAGLGAGLLRAGLGVGADCLHLCV